ncbi:MAG: tetratricopeptide repeat protein [Pseudomonadota bacterium]
MAEQREAEIGAGSAPGGRKKRKSERPPQSAADASFNQALERHRKGDLERAETLYRAAIQADPTNASAWSNLGVLYRNTDRLEASVAVNRKAVELAPDRAALRNNLANALHDSGRFAAAEPYRRALLIEDPTNPLRLRDLAATLRAIDRHEDVITLVDAAEADGVADEECRLQRGFSNLMLGRYRAGFADFEARFAGGEVTLPKLALPRWTGGPVEGKRVLVTAEQGFGDAVLMARFLPRLKAMGAHVTLFAKRPLRRLFSGLEGVDAVVERVEAGSQFDLFTPNMSLPHLVGMPEDAPPPAPRLTVPEDSRARAAELVAPFRDRFRIGIVWTGSLTYRGNRRRSVTPEHFLGLAAMPGVQLFSLYKGDAHADFLASGAAGAIVDACGADRDFADSAAVAEAMDLMITTDTGIVHVAASLGLPVWNLLSAEGFWLYGRGERTPWYPSMRLFRQARMGEWGELFARVEAAVEAERAARDGAGGGA